MNILAVYLNKSSKTHEAGAKCIVGRWRALGHVARCAIAVSALTRVALKLEHKTFTSHKNSVINQICNQCVRLVSSAIKPMAVRALRLEEFVWA